MQQPAVEPAVRRILAAPASVGALLDLCEENYQLLGLIAPGLRAMRGSHRACRPGQPDLHLDVLDQTAYTTTLRLTYYFDDQAGGAPDPDATLRVYHDARQLEVLDLRQQVLPVGRSFVSPALACKWKASVFLSKWLWYCVRCGQRFPAAAQQPQGPGGAGQGTDETPQFPVGSAG